MKKIYLSGPMSGLPDQNFPAFHAAAAALRAKGLQVVNPAEITPAGENTYENCLRADVKELCDCHTIALLPGWQNSDGAHLVELYLAKWFGMRIVTLNELMDEVYVGVAA